MSNKLKFVWVDDSPDREIAATNMRRSLKVSLKFENANKKDLNIVIAKIVNGPRPDAIIIDHNLHLISSGLSKTGSTVAAYFREKWANIPILCITGVELHKVDHQQKALYDEMFESTRISSYYSTIISIVKSFKKFNSHPPTAVEDLINFLLVPEIDRPKLHSVLPKQLKTGFNDRALINEFSNWVRKVFMERPGFLYDRLSVATLLGLKVKSFKKVEELFRSAKYKGLFADVSNERWWKSEVLSILNKRIISNELPWEKGRKLPGILRIDFSRSLSGEFYPEVVAFIEETDTSNRAPMKLRETIHHPGYEDMLFFDEIRLMKPNDN